MPLLAGLLGAAENDVADFLGIDGIASEQRLDACHRQIVAARIAIVAALGMSPAQAVRTVILPQALIRMLPNLGSLLVIAVKDSAIASVVAVPELMRQSQILAGRTYRPFEIYTAAMLVYFCLCYPVARCVEWMRCSTSPPRWR